MNKSTLILPIGFALTATLNAQSPSPLSIRFGYSALTNNTAQALTNQNGLAVGLGFDLPRFGQNLSLDLNYTSHRGHLSKIDSTSLFVVKRFPFAGGSDSSGPQNYFGIGLGVANHSSKFVISANSSTTTVSSNKYFGAGEFLLGFRMDDKNSIELVLQVSPRTLGVVPNTLSLVYSKHF